MRHLVALALALFGALPGRAEEARDFGLFAAPEIATSGLLDYILPRFTLKTGRRVRLVEAGADARLGPPFDPARPPPIVPVTLSIDEVEAVQARVAGLEAADPGGENVNR